MIRSCYIHIPFCSSICSYCDFSKYIKNDLWIDKYLSKLDCEIKEKYNNEILDTIYIGGGTPSCLNINQLNKLFDIIKQLNKSNNLEFTFECNINDIDEQLLLLLKNNGVNRLSIGVQTFNNNLLKYLNRTHTSSIVKEKILLCKTLGFNNINIDLIYAIKDENLDILNTDLDEFLLLDINHISTYSLIIEPNTKLYINNEINIDDEIDFKMYELICNKLEKNGFIHYEISNFAKPGFESKHNLTYWNNNEYYGFGIGASGYINNIRYDNTKSINEYLKGNYINTSNKLSIKETIENEFILGFRKIKGIDKKEFFKKYNKNLKELDVINKLLKENKLLEDKKSIYINPSYIYTSNDILIEFID